MRLQSAINVLRGLGERMRLSDYDSAISVLEVAEKVDKKDCLAWLGLAKAWFIPGHSINADYIQPQDQIRALLESLPEKEK